MCGGMPVLVACSTYLVMLDTMPDACCCCCARITMRVVLLAARQGSEVEAHNGRTLAIANIVLLFRADRCVETDLGVLCDCCVIIARGVDFVETQSCTYPPPTTTREKFQGVFGVPTPAQSWGGAQSPALLLPCASMRRHSPPAHAEALPPPSARDPS